MSLVLVTKSTSAPSNPYDGQVWVDTTSVPVIKVYDAGNTTWIVQGASSEVEVALDAHGIEVTAGVLSLTPVAADKDLELSGNGTGNVNLKGGWEIEGVVVAPTAAQLNAQCGYTANNGIHQIILPGAVEIDVNAREVLLSDNTTGIAATIADAAALAGRLIIFKQIGASAVDHTITITSGSWDGTKKVATFQDANDALVVWFDYFGNGTIVENIGSVTFEV